LSKVYIGVGHGGSDPGAVSGSHREADYALDIASACTAELKLYGVAVMQSRSTDITESSAAKIRECNNYSPDLALDIHLNAGGGDGFEVFHSISGGKGKALAKSIENTVKAIGQNSRGLKTKTNKNGKDYFGFIRQTNCPALLVECAFVDSKDVAIVDAKSKRQIFGRAIAHGILDYLGVKRNNSSGSTTDKNTSEEVSSEKTSSSISSENAIVALPILKRGSDAPDYQVKRIQLCLNQMGWTSTDGKALTVDGVFGLNTEHAIRQMQSAHGLTPDGIMNAKTWRCLLVFKR